MEDWNIIVTIYQDGFRRALHALRDIGSAERSPYHNVIVMKSDDPMRVLDEVERLTTERPALYDAIARVAPAARTFEFESSAAFKDRAISAIRDWLPGLNGRTFHVRIHRRGSKFDLHTPDIERHLDDAILAATAEGGAPAHISFTDPDAVIVIDTIDDHAGVSLWTREQLARHRLLRPD